MHCPDCFSVGCILYFYQWGRSRNVIQSLCGWFMVFNASFSNISVISWRSVLLVEETVVPGENHRPIAYLKHKCWNTNIVNLIKARIYMKFSYISYNTSGLLEPYSYCITVLFRCIYRLIALRILEKYCLLMRQERAAKTVSL